MSSSICQIHQFGPRCLLFTCLILFAQATWAQQQPLRVAIIGGLERTDFWARMEPAIEAALEFQLETVASAPKEQVVPEFMRGEADLLLIHGGDETFALEALDYAGPLRTWGYNEFVFVGPTDDPAGIAGAASGREAMLRLQASGAPLISFRDIASQQIIRRLLDAAGLYPRDINLIPDTADRPQQILRQAARDDAYVIVGHIPAASGRMPGEGVSVLLAGDPAMRRGYVVVTPGPEHPADAVARQQAEAVARYLVSDAGQAALEAIKQDGQTWFFPRREAGALLEFP